MVKDDLKVFNSVQNDSLSSSIVDRIKLISCSVAFTVVLSSGAVSYYSDNIDNSGDLGIYDNNIESESMFLPMVDLKKMENLNTIKKMGELEYGWNGHNALAFSREALAVFTQIIEKLSIQPQIAPTGRNSMYMQYELDDKSKLFFEVFSNKVDQVILPQGKCELAKVGCFTQNLCDNVSASVKEFYGIG